MATLLLNLFQTSRGEWRPGTIPDFQLRTRNIQANAAGYVEQIGDHFKYIVNRDAVSEAQKAMLAIMEQLPKERIVTDRNKAGTYRLGKVIG